LPIPAHQRVSLKLSLLFEVALNKCKDCKVYPPLDWKIAEDTIVQPDVLIVCKKIEKKFLDFPPVRWLKCFLLQLHQNKGAKNGALSNAESKILFDC
jgi:hypothetical protein